PIAEAAQHIQEEPAVDEDVGDAVVVDVDDNRAAPAVAPLRVRPVGGPLQTADRSGLAREPALAVVEVDDDLLPFHANEVGMTVLVEIPDAVDAAALAEATLAGDVGPLHRTAAAEDLPPCRRVEVRLPGDQFQLSVAIEIDRNRARATQPGADHRV